MIKIYLDWNIISGLKQGYFSELKKTLESNNKFVMPYSISHIGDILANNPKDPLEDKHIKSDLEYLSQLSNELCLSYYKGETRVGKNNPFELFKERIESNKLVENLSIDSLFKPFENGPEIGATIKALKGLLSSIPLGKEFEESFNNPDTSEMMNKQFPGLKDNPTMDGFFEFFGKMFHDLNNTEAYKDLRESIQQTGINSSHFNEEKNPFDLIEKSYSKFGNDASPYKYLQKNEITPDWFSEITNLYLVLDMHGFKSDKIKVTVRNKSTFRNTTEDSSHTAFASICEIYLTNDKKNIYKSKAVYEKLDISCKVFNVEQFLDYSRKYLDDHSIQDHFKQIHLAIKEGKFHSTALEKGRGKLLTHFSNHYFFNFFNKLMLIYNESEEYEGYVLTKLYTSKNYVILREEIQGVVKLLVDAWGQDSNSAKYLELNELKDSELDWTGRYWEFDFATFRFCRLNGWFQFYVYPMEEGVDLK